MAQPLSGNVYLIVGAFITGFSLYITMQPGRNFIIFIIVGCVMILIGLLKKLGEKNKEKKEVARRDNLFPQQQGHPAQAQHPYAERSARQHQQAAAATRQAPAAQQARSHSKYCSHCGAHLKAHDRFCSMCGSRIM